MRSPETKAGQQPAAPGFASAPTHSVQPAQAEVKDAACSVRLVQLAEIVTDAGTQVRMAADAAAIDDYARDMAAGAEFPPIVVFHDGSRYCLADGFHRVLAATRVGRTEIVAEVRIGGVQDAVWFALGANARNGMRLTADDKRNAVDRVLREFSDKSLRDVAEHVGCSPEFVRQRKAQVSTVDTCLPARVHGRDGKHYPATRKAAAKTATTAPARLELPAAPPSAPADPAPASAPASAVAPAPVAPVDADEDDGDDEPMPEIGDQGEHRCPFCGSGWVQVNDYSRKGYPRFFVSCQECQAHGPTVTEFEPRAPGSSIAVTRRSQPYDMAALKLEAVTRWNAAPRPVQATQDASEPVACPDTATTEPAPLDAVAARYRDELWRQVCAKSQDRRPAVRAAMLAVAAMIEKAQVQQ